MIPSPVQALPAVAVIAMIFIGFSQVIVPMRGSSGPGSGTSSGQVRPPPPARLFCVKHGRIEVGGMAGPLLPTAATGGRVWGRQRTSIPFQFALIFSDIHPGEISAAFK